MEREVGGGIGMGNTCKPMAVSFHFISYDKSMTKFTTIKKKKKKKMQKFDSKKKKKTLLGRKVMTNLDSILKSRDIILPTKSV